LHIIANGYIAMLISVVQQVDKLTLQSDAPIRFHGYYDYTHQLVLSASFIAMLLTSCLN